MWPKIWCGVVEIIFGCCMLTLIHAEMHHGHNLVCQESDNNMPYTHSCQQCTWTEHLFGVPNPCMSRIWQKVKDTLTTMCTWIDIWVPNMYVKMLTNSVHKSTRDILSFKQVSRIWGSLQSIHYMWSSFQELLRQVYFMRRFSEELLWGSIWFITWGNHLLQYFTSRCLWQNWVSFANKRETSLFCQHFLAWASKHVSKTEMLATMWSFPIPLQQVLLCHLPFVGSSLL